MPDQPSDALPAAGGASSRADNTELTADWRRGGPSVDGWRDGLLAIALISIGAAVLLATALRQFWSSPWAASSATACIWIGMLVPVLLGLARSRPAGLLRFRWLDLLYAVTLGGLLRLVQGWTELATGGSGAFPTTTLVDGRLPGSWWVAEALPAIVVAPPVEELFFRGVVLVSLYTLLLRPAGPVAAAASSVLATTAFFVALHLLEADSRIDVAISLSLLGLTCGALVVLTGRIWGAIAVHSVFNATYVGLVIAGSL